jgi:hypothetical protein
MLRVAVGDDGRGGADLTAGSGRVGTGLKPSVAGSGCHAGLSSDLAHPTRRGAPRVDVARPGHDGDVESRVRGHARSPSCGEPLQFLGDERSR